MTIIAPEARVLAAFLALSACAGQQGNADGRDPTAGCSGRCAEAGVGLTVADTQKILAQGIAEARARGIDATLAVVDRVGNVLAVYRMGQKDNRTVTLATYAEGQTPIQGGLEGIKLPIPGAMGNLDDQAAISKAITGAFLSSEGNAFSTRTASQIIQQHFEPGEERSPAGPLFGVQFSQLPCSDLMRSSNGVAPTAGPQRAPLGLSADPGGFPLYKSGTPVGAVGVIADGRYGLDRNTSDRDNEADEAIAYAATFGFAAPIDRSSERITAGGKTLRFSDVGFLELRAKPAAAPAFETIAATVGALIPVTGYFDGNPRAGTMYGQPASGVRSNREGVFAGQDAFVLVDENDVPRFAPRSGTEAAALGVAPLSSDEVTTLLRSALGVAKRTRAQIRRPLGSQAQVSISVCDSAGGILGIVRTRDAPLFGVDVSLQKARSAALFSSGQAPAFLSALPDAQYLTTSTGDVRIARSIPLQGYATATQAFLPDTLDGRIAYSSRALGNIARPFFPDGIDGTAPGTFSKPLLEWSVLSTGLQLDLSLNAILQHILYVAGATATDVAPGCTGVGLSINPLAFSSGPRDLRLGNGLQIFPGGVPIYRAGKLVGAVGVSGDGTSEDDMIAFLGVHDAAGSITNAPSDRRADTLTPREVRLRYVECPVAPFTEGDEQRPCEGK